MAPAEPSSTTSLPAPERILAGFCHDLNGHLASAAGFAHLMGPGSDADGPGRHLREALDRIEDLVRQLRWLARDDHRDPEPTSLADLLAAVTGILPRHPRFRHAEVTVDGPGDLPAVRVDFGSAVRVLLQAIDLGTGTEALGRVVVSVEVGPDRVAVGAGAHPLEPGSRLEALDREIAEAGLARRGGDGEQPLRIVLPRLV